MQQVCRSNFGILCDLRNYKTFSYSVPVVAIDPAPGSQPVRICTASDVVFDLVRPAVERLAVGK